MDEIINERTLERARGIRELIEGDMPPVIEAVRDDRVVATLFFDDLDRDALLHVLHALPGMLSADEVMLLLDMRMAVVDMNEHGQPVDKRTGRVLEFGDVGNDMERQETLGVFLCKRDIGSEVSFLPYDTVGMIPMWRPELNQQYKDMVTSMQKRMESPLISMMEEAMTLPTTDFITEDRGDGLDPRTARVMGDAFSLGLLVRRHPIFHIVFNPYGDDRDDLLEHGMEYVGMRTNPYVNLN